MRGPRMLLLQKSWAAEQTELFPPLLHAMIYTLLNPCIITREMKGLT